MNKKKLKNTYKERYKIEKSQLDKFDAYDLLKGGAPEDEFEQETMIVLSKINQATTIQELAEEMSFVYRSQFDDDFTAQEFLPYAKEIIEQIQKL